MNRGLPQYTKWPSPEHTKRKDHVLPTAVCMISQAFRESDTRFRGLDGVDPTYFSLNLESDVSLKIQPQTEK